MISATRNWWMWLRTRSRARFRYTGRRRSDPSSLWTFGRRRDSRFRSHARHTRLWSTDLAGRYASRMGALSSSRTVFVLVRELPRDLTRCSHSMKNESQSVVSKRVRPRSLRCGNSAHDIEVSNGACLTVQAWSGYSWYYCGHLPLPIASSYETSLRRVIPLNQTISLHSCNICNNG
jgi:hypothetical protein